ncbi:MAG TPA: methyltransferase domain-containing protein [Myxococcota bacterium]|jgi:predicted SAM-dependent methyltransferase
MRRSIWSYGKVQKCVGAVARNRRLQMALVPRLPYVNIGCGSNFRPGFINVDYEWRPGIHLCWDLRRKLPLPDASAEGIFTEHCLEHLTVDACAEALRDLHRILAPGGVLRVIIPDGGLYIESYLRHRRGEPVEFPYVDAEGRADFLRDSHYGFTPMMAVNRIFRGYGHLFAYDHDTIRNLLVHAGFASVEPSSFRRGRLEALLIDSEVRAPQSLFVEAVK